MKIRNSFLLLLAALVWGIAFVAQTEGGDAIGPYSFGASRYLIAGVVLRGFIIAFDKAGISVRRPETKEDRRKLLAGGISCGICLFVASSLQQVGITLGASAGKAGFLTTCYIILVPFLGLFIKKKCGANIWIGVVLTLIGLYLLCYKAEAGNLGIVLADILLLLCALGFSFHILIVDHFSPLVDGVRLSSIQFLIAGALSVIPTVVFEMKPFSGGFETWALGFLSQGAWISILYAAIMSSCVGYTLQIIGQNGVNPTLASLLMSLEAVFAALAGWILLNQRLSGKEILGCFIIFVAIIIAQLPRKED